MNIHVDYVRCSKQQSSSQSHKFGCDQRRLGIKHVHNAFANRRCCWLCQALQGVLLNIKLGCCSRVFLSNIWSKYIADSDARHLKNKGDLQVLHTLLHWIARQSSPCHVQLQHRAPVRWSGHPEFSTTFHAACLPHIAVSPSSGNSRRVKSCLFVLGASCVWVLCDW